MLFKASQFFLYASLLCVTIVLAGTFFPFIGGKYYFFRIMISLSSISFLLWWAFEATPAVSSKLINDLFTRPLFWAVSAFVLMVLLSSIFAYDPNAAFWSNFERGEGAFQMLHYYLLFCLSLLLLRTWTDWKRVMYVSLTAAVLMILYGVFAYLFLYQPAWFCTPGPDGGFASCNTFFGRLIHPYQGVSPEDLPKTLSGLFTSNRFQGSLGNPAYVAPYLLFAMFYALFLWWQGNNNKAWLNALLYGGLTAFFLIFFILSQTRGAFLGLIAAIFVFLIFLGLSLPKARKWTSIGTGVFLALVILLFSFGHSPIIQKLPFSRLFVINLQEETAQTRLWTWGSAWEGFKERPLLGWGLENFSAVFDKHFDPRHFVPGKNSETWFDRAHSIIFDYLAETGLFGFLSYMSMFAVLFWHLGTRLYASFRGQITKWGEITMAKAVPMALIAGAIVSYLVQGLILFDVLPIYINVFVILALSSFIFESREQPLEELSKKS